MARYTRGRRSAAPLGPWGRLKKALSNLEFEFLFVLFAGMTYVTGKYLLYKLYAALEANKIVVPDFKDVAR